MSNIKEKSDFLRSEYLTVKMNSKEKQEIQKAADDMGIGMSSYARIAIKEFTKKNSI